LNRRHIACPAVISRPPPLC